MNAIRIEVKLDLETLYLPQLKPLVGKHVQIVVQEITAPHLTPAMGDLAAVQNAVLNLADYDFDAWHMSREAELPDANVRPT